MKQSVIFKLLAREDYSVYLDWQRQYPASSYVCLNQSGSVNSIDLHVRSKDPSLGIFQLIQEKTLGFLKFAGINAEEGNAYVSVLMPHMFEEYVAYLKAFIGRFASDEGLHKLQSRVLDGDIRSREQMVQLGFREEGMLKEQWFGKGSFRDIILYGMEVGTAT